MYDRFPIQRLIDLWLTEDIGYCDLTVLMLLITVVVSAVNALLDMVDRRLQARLSR